MRRTILVRLFCLLFIWSINTSLSLCQTETNSSSSTEQYHRIVRLISEKNYVQAITESQNLIERAPGYEQTYDKFVLASNLAGELDQARTWLDLLTQRTPPNPWAYYGIGLIDSEKKNYASAIDNYQKCLKDLPEFDLPMVFLVSAAFTGDKAVDIEAYLKSWLDAHPHSPTAHLGYGYYLSKSRKPEQAAKELELAISLKPRTSNPCFYSVYVWYNERRFAEAVEAVQKCLPVFEADPDEENKKYNFVIVGITYRGAGNYSEAIKYFEKALGMARSIGDSVVEGNTLGQLGSVYLRQDDYSKALSSYQRAFEIARELKRYSEASRHLGNLGEVHFLLGDLTAATQHYRQALEMAKEAGDEVNQASLLMEIGRLLVAQDDLSQAVASYEQGLAVAVRQANPALLSTGLNALGAVYLKTKNYPKAMESLDQALILAREMSSPELEATSLNNLGDLLEHQGELRPAIESFEQALRIAVPTNNLRNVWKAQAGLAAAYEKLNQLDKAREHYLNAIEVMENVRARLGGEEEKAGFFQDKVAVYKRQIALLLDLHAKDAKRRYDVEAFHYSELARARALLDLLAEARVDVDQTVSLDLLKRRQEVQQRISQLTAQLLKERSLETSKQDQAKIGELEKGLGQADAELGNWLRELRRRNPRYATLKYPEPVTLADAQRMLDEKTILLSYSLTEPQSFLFAISRNDFQVKRLPSEAKLAASVQKLLAAITDKNNPAPAEYRRQAARLSQQLLQPVSQMLAGKKALVIVADGALHRLPFEALFRPGVPAQGDLRRLPYLIRQFAISYAPSASVLAELRNESHETAPKGFIAFGDPMYEQRAAGVIASTLRATSAGGQLNLQRLPYSHTEIDGIAQLFAKDDSELFFGEAATEENVKAPERLSHYRMVHFSTHGYLNEARPRFSGLVLSLRSSSSRTAANPQSEDGLLSAYEIFNLKLKADLVVLSACETGLGKEVKGEGLMSLTRAFMYAGTPSVVVSLWNVNDESAADLMIRFYRHLLTGMNKSEALRQAQLETIPENGFPFFWAPFVLVGKP
jgi:CHAT domain-containing protein/tetratricopeptide (TPR) repeat protein